MKNRQLLAEVEDLLRTCPSLPAFRESGNIEVLRWLGRTTAVLKKWDYIRSASLDLHIGQLLSSSNDDVSEHSASTRELMATVNEIFDDSVPAYRKIRTLLFQAQYDLLIKTGRPLSVAIPAGSSFDYFDNLRKLIEMAREDLLFVDPYLDAEFVSVYLTQIARGVTVRLLTSKKLSSLLPAVKHLSMQLNIRIQVRSSSTAIHDRYLFVDKRRCYQSGASFKDGAKQSPTTVTQITDAFEAVLETYERMWSGGKIANEN